MTPKYKQIADEWIKEYQQQFKRTTGKEIQVTVDDSAWFTVGTNHFKCRLSQLKEYCAVLCQRPDHKAWQIQTIV